MGIFSDFGGKIRLVKNSAKILFYFKGFLAKRPLQTKRLYDLFDKISGVAESSGDNARKSKEILRIIADFKRENWRDYDEFAEILDDFLDKYANKRSEIKQILAEILR